MARKDKQSKQTKDAKWQLSDVHPHHDEHLCHIVGLRNMKAAGRLAKNAEYLCAVCGRAAKKQVNLCVPVKL